MNRDHEKMMADLHRLIAAQNIESPEELQKFMDGMIGKKIPTFNADELSIPEQAKDLVFEATNLSQKKAKNNIIKALRLDPECIEAYEYLSSEEPFAEIAIAFIEKAVRIGRQRFGGKFLEDYKGHFYEAHETRPFMRCLQQNAICLYEIGKTEEALTILKEMIELNPNDNLGSRELISLYSLEIEDYDTFEKYDKQFAADISASTYFNRALFTFKREGKSQNATTKLKEALKSNKFVAAKLLSYKPPMELPETYSLGDESEADYYAAFAQTLWNTTPGAPEWLKKHTK